MPACKMQSFLILSREQYSAEQEWDRKSKPDFPIADECNRNEMYEKKITKNNCIVMRFA